MSMALAVGVVLFAWQTGRAGDADAQADTKAESEGIIFERQLVMKQLEEDTDTLGKIVAGELPADKLADTTRAIAQGAHDAVEAFKPNVPGGRAKPEVWGNYTDFSSRMVKFATDTQAMAKAGEAGDTNAVMGMMIAALPCRECHDVYREKKKQ